MSQSSPEDNISDLVSRCRAGNEEAATILFRWHLDKLIALVRSRLSQKLNSRMDPEDILQSAYRSFFGGLVDGKFKVERSDELWSLLAAITLHKLYRQVARHTAKKRTVQRERPIHQDDSLLGVEPELVAELPTPAQAAAVVEELEHVMDRLDTLEQTMLQLRLEGYTVEEIAAKVDRSERTVRRLLEKIKDLLQCRLIENTST